MSIESQSNAKTGGSGITFPVDPVTQAERPLLTENLAVSLTRRFQRKILILPDEQEQVVNACLDSFRSRSPAVASQGKSFEARALEKNELSTVGSLYGERRHPFIEAVHLAFAQHRPLTFSPDTIWLLIAQGFSHHVAENAESLRPQLVRHEGSRELQVECRSLTPDGFIGAISDFSALIRQETNSVLHDTLVCDFSTTTPAIRTASEVVLMDSFSSYFTYAMLCVCGIPKITIEGTPADWQKIRARVEVLAIYGLEWWILRLRPILDEFVLAAEGRPDVRFWQAIYKPEKAYASDVATGWVTDLFPYLGDAPKRRRNHVLKYERHDWAIAVDQGVKTTNLFHGPVGVGTKSFPSGVSSALLKVSVNSLKAENLDLVAGFVGVCQNRFDLSLSPLIRWCVAERPPEQPVRVVG